MYRIVFIIFFTFSFLTLKAQTLFSIDGKNVNMDEFDADSQGVIKEEDGWDFNRLVEMYADYRLEVYDAKQRKLDTSKVYRQAVNYYGNFLITQHVFSSKTAQKYLKESFERSKYQYRVSYIKVNIPANSKTDTLVAYRKAMKIRDRLLSGYNFSRLARQLSDDENASFNGGLLGWVAPCDFNCGYTAENYIISHYDQTEWSMPVRSGDFFYIIKVEGKREAVSTVRLGIVLKYKKKSPLYNDSIRNVISEAYKDLNNGTSLLTVQEKYSEFPHKTFETSLESAYKHFSTQISKTEKIGDLSPVFETDYFIGFVKLENRTLKVFDENYTKEIEEKFYGNNAYKKCYDDFFDSLKVNSGYQKLSSIKPLYKLFPDSTIYMGKWKPEGYLGFYSDPLFKFYGTEYTLGDFAQYVYDTQSESPYDAIEHYLQEKYDEYLRMLAGLKIFEILKNNKNYISKMRVFSNYELYKLAENKNGFLQNASDEQKVYAFYKTSGLSYKTSHVLQIDFYDYLTDKNRKKALKFVQKNGGGKETSFLKPIKSGVFQKGDDPLADKIINDYDSGNYGKITVLENEHILAVTTIEKLPEDLSAKEIHPLVYLHYIQSQKENYIKDLRRKYKLEIWENTK
jgi:peptidyl-prolyl cis-trans isomerase SurA